MLELFHKMPCPFSKDVRDFISENGLESQIKYRDILKDPKNAEDLSALTGRETVPCLVIDGKPLFESADIIDWLEDNIVSRERGDERPQASV